MVTVRKDDRNKKVPSCVHSSSSKETLPWGHIPEIVFNLWRLPCPAYQPLCRGKLARWRSFSQWREFKWTAPRCNDHPGTDHSPRRRHFFDALCREISSLVAGSNTQAFLDFETSPAGYKPGSIGVSLQEISRRVSGFLILRLPDVHPHLS
jgi:hypothetical protein